MPSIMDMPSAAEVTTHLRQAKYPADREALLRVAREAQAPERVQRLIGQLGDRVYGGVAEVSEAVEKSLAASTRAPGEDTVEKASEDSFPASDPPAYASARHVGRPPEEKK